MTLVEFLGMSRSGKSTQGELVMQTLTKKGYSCELFTRPKIPFSDVYSTERFHEIMFEVLLGEKRNNTHDFLIFDRGFYDRQVLLNFDYQKGEVSRDFVDTFLPKLETEAEDTTQAFLFLIDPHLSLARWHQQKLLGKDSSELSKGLETGDNLSDLVSLKENYLELKGSFTCPYHVIDASQSIADIHSILLNKLCL